MSNLVKPNTLGPNDKVLFEWAEPISEQEFLLDYPDAYVVTREENRTVIWGRYPRSWYQNPRCEKLVEHLLNKIDELTRERDEARAKIGKTAG